MANHITNGVSLHVPGDGEITLRINWEQDDFDGCLLSDRASVFLSVSDARKLAASLISTANEINLREPKA